MVYDLEGTISEMVADLLTFRSEPSFTILFERFGSIFGIVTSRFGMESPKTVPNYVWSCERVGSTVSETVLTKSTFEVNLLGRTLPRG